MPSDLMLENPYSFEGDRWMSGVEKGPITPYLEDETEIALPQRTSTLFRLSMLAFLMLVAVPWLSDVPLVGIPGASIIGAKAGVLRRSTADTPTRIGPPLSKRSDSPTDFCHLWGHQSALINGTIYVYGGHTTSSADQGTTNSWTNGFFSVDVTKDFKIEKPLLNALDTPSNGPPAVANAYLWQSYDALYLYGGLVSDTPAVKPQPYSLWAYDIPSAKWIEHSNPKTSSGNNSDPGNQPVQQAAEGAGVSIPELGRGYYFAGHLDPYTTPNWPLSTTGSFFSRVYLKSMIEYTFPGYTNDGVESLSGGKKAGSDGVWRNITQGGIQDNKAFPYRADGTLVHVPGFGAEGILLSLGGGTNLSFVSLYSGSVVFT